MKQNRFRKWITNLSLSSLSLRNLIFDAMESSIKERSNSCKTKNVFFKQKLIAVL